MRIAVCIHLGEAPGLLPPAFAYQGTWISGGMRTMHELAAAAAAHGHDVELRGPVDEQLVAEIALAMGARITTPAEPREATGDDVVITTEGHPNPRDWATAMLSPARTVVMLLAPPGLFGWPFTDDWVLPDPLTVDPMDVGRAKHLSAMAACGFELWTNNSGIARVGASAGVPCIDVGRGTPGGPPALRRKTTDVAVVSAGRWRDLAVYGLEGVQASVDWIPSVSHAELMDRIGAARILVHLPRIEGHSRVTTEARSLGTVPIGLQSNRFAAGLDEESGGLAVPSPADVAGAVRDLLDDPGRLARLAEAGRRTAAAELDWQSYVRRVGRALGGPTRPETARVALGVMARAVANDRQALVREVLSQRDALAAFTAPPSGTGSG